MAGEDIGRVIERRFGQQVMVRKAGDVLGRQIPGDALVLNPFPVTVLRTADLLLVRFSFRNLHWVKLNGADVLARRDAGKPAFLIADFPPQHLVERAFAERASDNEADKKLFERAQQLPFPSDREAPKQEDEDDPPEVPPVEVSLSRHSRLVFRVEGESIRWSLEGLLAAMSTLPLSVAPHAKKSTRAAVWDRKFIDILKNAEGIKELVDNRSGAVSAMFQAVGRSAATARVLDHHLGSAVGAEIASNSRLASRLKLPPGVVVPHVPGVLLRPSPTAPTTTQTAIELPWRLQISPHSDGGFTHASAPVEHDDRVELWHSRLGVRVKDQAGEIHVDEGKSESRTVRAIWARDIVGDKPDPKKFDSMGADGDPDFVKALTSRDRVMLVDETSNFTLKRGKKAWDPPAVDVDLLMLTTLGGWLRSEFNAPVLPNGEYSITEWKHRAAMGRDHEVKVVYAGFLFPFGHPASLVKVTERKIDTRPPLLGRYAYLRQRFFIVVRQQTMTYPESPKTWTDAREYSDRHGEKRLDLAMPFSSISILTRITPDLDPPEQEPGISGAFCFFPSVDDTPFPFKILATDREGQMVEYGGPLMFIGRERNTDAPSVDTVTEVYWNATRFKRVHHLGGQRVAFADALGPADQALDTTLAVDTLQFDAAPLNEVTENKQDQAQFWPILRTAGVVVPAMSALAGVATTTTMVQPKLYLERGFENNQTYVFLEVAVKPTEMSFAQQADRSGGFATPNLAVTGLSGSKGPIGGPIDDAINGTMTALKYFAGPEIPGKLFGVVALSELLEDVGLTPDNMPSFVAKGVNRVTGFLDDMARIDAIASDVQTRFAADPDAGIQDLRNELAATQGRARAVLTAFADTISLADAGAAITQSRVGLGNLKQKIDGATALPSGLRGEAAGIVQRLVEYAEASDDIVDRAEDLLNGVQLPETVGAKLSWSTALAPWPADGAPLFQPRQEGVGAAARATLDLCVEVQAPIKPGAEPTTTTTCSITPFSLRLLGRNTFITLAVDVIEFTMLPGRKPDVNVVLGSTPIEFGGPLRFVDKLREYIEPDAFSDPPYLDVDAQGIRAGFDLALPDIQVGAMSLSNVSLAGQANVPFIADSLDFTFSFGTRENPFRITVWLFGGGGFFGISITPNRCRMLEAALEFGAAAAINLGVASGNVEYMAGIYFKLQPNTDNGDEGQLCGYYRARGEVDVLGLLTQSIELYMELNYDSAENTAGGRASLTIEVEVAGLSKSVTLTLEKKFHGSMLDPSFEEMMSVAAADGTRAWDEYCNAFAAN